MRQDVITGTLERATPGKFVETLVQALQHLESGAFDKKPKVDEFLRDVESRTGLDDGLRLCASRVGRAMYTLRNKRNVAHKGEVDPNTTDLRFLHHSAQWIIAEFVRTLGGLSVEEAGQLVDEVQAPAGGLVEDFGDRKLVLADMKAREEVLVLLHSYHPARVASKTIVESMNRFHKNTVRTALGVLWETKLIDGSWEDGYKLTASGFSEAIEVYKRFV